MTDRCEDCGAELVDPGEYTAHTDDCPLVRQGYCWCPSVCADCHTDHMETT